MQTNKQKKVLVASTISKQMLEAFNESEYELICEASQNSDSVYGIITSNKLYLDEAKIKTFNNLNWIARIGSGTEIIDIDYCKQKNINVFSSPKGIANAVAEHVIALILGLQKNIFSASEQMKNKQFIREENRGVELEEKTIGIIGYGNTGRATAKKLSVFSDKILAFDINNTIEFDNFVTPTTLENLIEQSDIITFHVPLNATTKNYFNWGTLFEYKKNNYILINTSRGEIINTEFLLEQLKHKKCIAAGLDVFENEHLQKENIFWETIEKLLTYNVMLTPHIAGYTHNATQKMCNEIIVQLKENKIL